MMGDDFTRDFETGLFTVAVPLPVVDGAFTEGSAKVADIGFGGASGSLCGSPFDPIIPSDLGDQAGA